MQEYNCAIMHPIFIVLVVIALFLLVWGLGYWIRRGLAPERLIPRVNPGDLGLPYRCLSIPTARGKTLQAWLVLPGEPPNEIQTAARPGVILLHGWGGNRDSLLPLVPALHKAGWACLLIDARCHGESDRDDFTSLPRFAEDLEAAAQAFNQPGISPVAPLAVIGHSVGAAAALLYASRRADLACVVSISAFSHPVNMMRRWFQQRKIPYFPVGWLILRYVQRVIGARFDDIAPVTRIRQLACPCLLIHGADDEMVPASEAMEIHAASEPGRTQLRIIPGTHEDFGDATELEIELVVRFLEDAFSRLR